MAELEPFELSVLAPPGGNGRRLWLSAVSRLGAVHGVPRRLQGTMRTAFDGAAGTFGQRVRTARPDPQWALELGWDLAELVFGVPEIDSLFRRTRGAAQERGRQLLVRIQAAPTSAATIPWELLADPEAARTAAGAHLAFSPDTHVVRTARARTYSVRAEPVALPLNVLLVLANPEDQANDNEVPFDLYEERRALLSELELLVTRGLLVVDVEDQPNVERLRRRIGARERGYHVVHYLGHARSSQLKLEDGDRQARWVDADDFNRVLRACPDLRLVFYAGCSTATNPDQRDEWPEALSIAERTVRDAATTVVGMQAELPFRTEQLLTRFFYQALASGQSVAQALKLGRAAVRDDDLVGGGLLDWAVPCLYASGTPDRIIDAAGTASPPPVVRPRAELRLDLTEPDREFFARQVELRRVLDVLCRRRSPRVLWVVGPPMAGKTRLVARALDELDDVAAVLYVRTGRLLNTEDGTAHAKGPVEELCDLVVELLARCGCSQRERDPNWDALEWWDRLIEDLTDTALVVVMDDVDELDGANPADVRRLGRAISRLVQRRTYARVALVGRAPRDGWLDQRAGAFTTVQTVQPLGFQDVWQWIRRNRPGLVRYGFEALACHYATLPSLEQWSELAQVLAANPLADLGAAVAELAPPPAAPAAAAPKPATGDPLRLAVAGLFLTGREAEFAQAATGFASLHGVGGRVVTADARDTTASIAELVQLPSPFRGVGPYEPKVIEWLRTVAGSDIDIVLLDYGTPQRTPEEEAAIDALLAKGALLVAAGGNSLEPSWPAWYPDVLAVGALEANAHGQQVAPYSYRDPGAGKPEVFAPVSLQGTPFAALLPPELGPDPRGSSMAAMNAVSTALVVWTANRSLSAADVRQVLVDSAVPLDAADPYGPRCLDVDAALARARTVVVRGVIEEKSQSRESVVAATGLHPNVVDDLLKKLQTEGKVARHATADGTQYRAVS